MKIILKNYNAIKLFPEGTSTEIINGLHHCMSGAKYTVDIKANTLMYEGGASPMFVHEDFPVGDGITVGSDAYNELDYIHGFYIEYSDLTEYPVTKKVLDIDFDNILLEDINSLISYHSRITPNSWECDGKKVLLKLITLLIKNY